MGTLPSTTNATATTVNHDVNEVVQLAEKTADTAAEAALDEAVPALALPVIKQIVDAIIEEAVSLLGNEVSIGLQEVGTFIVIDTQISSEKGGISQALANLMIAEKSGDPNAIQAAIAAYSLAQSALANDDGSATAST